MKLNNTLFVLDTETGGLNPNDASLMEIAGIILKDNKVIHKYSSLVKSADATYKCSEFARKMHGISNEMADEHGNLPIDIIKELNKIKNEYFDGSPMTIVAHNASFDISFIKKMFEDAKGASNTNDMDKEILNYDNMFSRNAIDTATMALVLRLQGKLPFDRCSLDNILTFYNIESPKKSRHTALADAEQTATAFINMFNSLTPNSNMLNFAREKYNVHNEIDESKASNAVRLYLETVCTDNNIYDKDKINKSKVSSAVRLYLDTVSSDYNLSLQDIVDAEETTDENKEYDTDFDDNKKIANDEHQGSRDRF